MQSFRDMSSLAPDCMETAPDAAAARAERRLALLEEMAEIGMNLLRRLGAEADGDPRETGEAFAKLSRAVRLTLALEAKTDRELAELKAGVETESAEQGRSRQAVNVRNEKKANAFDLLVAVRESESESFEDLLEAIAEPSGAPVETESDSGPSGMVIDRLCRALGVSPALSSRVGAGWQTGYLATRPRRNPLKETGMPPVWPPPGYPL